MYPYPEKRTLEGEVADDELLNLLESWDGYREDRIGGCVRWGAWTEGFWGGCGNWCVRDWGFIGSRGLVGCGG